MIRFLQSWWSRTYSRPLKDPILLSYSFEELLYEFFDHQEREAYAEEMRDKESDKIEDEKMDAALQWADEEESKENSGLDPRATSSTPKVTPDDIAWMEEQMRQDKAQYGESFGEDIVEEF